MAYLYDPDPDPDPARRRRRRTRGIPRSIRKYPGLVAAWLKRAGRRMPRRRRRYDPGVRTYTIRTAKKIFRGPRGGVAWVGKKKRRYDPDPGVPRGLRRPLRWLTPLVGILSYIYANVKKDAATLNDVPSKLIEHHTHPTQYLPKTVGEYWERLKGNSVSWLGIAGWIYSVLPVRRLPAKRTIGNLGKAATVGTALGAVLDPPKPDASPVDGGAINKPVVVCGNEVIR
jgi:hypothetical protein